MPSRTSIISGTIFFVLLQICWSGTFLQKPYYCTISIFTIKIHRNTCIQKAIHRKWSDRSTWHFTARHWHLYVPGRELFKWPRYIVRDKLTNKLAPPSEPITKFGGEEIQEDEKSVLKPPTHVFLFLVLQLKIKMKQQFRIFLRAHICKGQIEICLIYNFLHLQLGRVEIKLLTVIPREA